MRIHGPFRQLLTMDNMDLRGPLADEQLITIEEGALAEENGKIIAAGTFEALKRKFPEAEESEHGRGMVVIPGFVDMHTHLCWFRDRLTDYAGRLSGKSYLEIAEEGGGIWSSVLKTRAASREELARLTAERAQRHFFDGVTTIEVKSGYGLSVESELKILEAIKMADDTCYADLIPTCLAAHIKPKDFGGTERMYLKQLTDELLPELKERDLTRRIDIFTETSAFTAEDSRIYLDAARLLGFDLTVHADQFTSGGSRVAVDAGALSADHLESSSEEDLDYLAASSTVAVALPGASMGLGMQYTPVRKLLDKGAIVAIATDWNPGSAPMGDLLMQAAVMGAFEKLTMAETLAAITVRAAAALGLDDRGALKKGMAADFQAYDTEDYRTILYRQGRLKPSVVWKGGSAFSR